MRKASLFVLAVSSGLFSPVFAANVTKIDCNSDPCKVHIDSPQKINGTIVDNFYVQKNQLNCTNGNCELMGYNLPSFSKNVVEPAIIEVPPPTDILRFAGSNTIGAQLIPALAEAYAIHKGAGNLKWNPPKDPQKPEEFSKVVEKLLEIGSPPTDFPKQIDIKAHGSGTAFEGLSGGNADIGMASRPIKDPDETSLFPDQPMVENPEAEHVLALDGLAIIVNPQNPITSLTVDQVCKIFSGQINDWSEIGGHPGEIELHARDDKSGTYDTFESLVLKTCKAKLDSTAKRYESNAKLSDTVAQHLNAIGFTGYAYVRQSKALDMDECGVLYSPTPFGIKTEEYPLSRRLYLYTPPRNKTPLITDFIDYATEAKDVIVDAGFVDQAPELGTTANTWGTLFLRLRSESQRGMDRISTQSGRDNYWQIEADATQHAGMIRDFMAVTRNATRLSVTFRFKFGSHELDIKALRDIRRLRDYMNGPGKGKQMILVGFADSHGGYHRNIELSKKRAEEIAGMLNSDGSLTVLAGSSNTILAEVDRLASQSFTPNILATGFGEEFPVACNEQNIDSRKNHKNRHVEVWLR